MKQKESFGLKGAAKEEAQAAWWTKSSPFSPARESGGMEGMDGCTSWDPQSGRDQGWKCVEKGVSESGGLL